MSVRQQRRRQVCEINWIRRIAGVKRVERRRTKDLGEEVGTKACIVGKIVKSRMKWAGENERREKLEKMRHKETGRLQKTRRRQLRWEDCVKRDL